MKSARSTERILRAEREKWTAPNAKLAKFDDIKPKAACVPRRFVVKDFCPSGRRPIIPGDKKANISSPRFLGRCLAIPAEYRGAGRIRPPRNGAGEWITKPDHPLTRG